MADNQETAAQAAQDTPSAEGSESSRVDEQVQVQDEGLETQPIATSENQESDEEKSESEEPGDQSEQKAKPTRQERRIGQLLDKLKEAGQPKSQSAPIVPENKPLFSPDEVEAGVIDPDLLQQRINQQVQQQVQQALVENEVRQSFQSAVKEHQADLDTVKDIDPDLEAEAIAEYEALNHQINPFTGEREFVPTVKLSEIVSKINSRAEKIAVKLAEKMVQNNQQHIQDVASSQAVPASGAISTQSAVTEDTTDFSAFEKNYTRS